MNTDVLIIGSGAAGLTAALELAETRKVAVLAKGAISDGATSWAQGGIAAVLETTDTFESHVEDTMIAGAGLNNRQTVEYVVEKAPDAIRRLADLGVPFDLGADKHWHLTREGGHSHRRIVHVHDATGLAVQQALEKAARDHPNITCLWRGGARLSLFHRAARRDGGWHCDGVARRLPRLEHGIHAVPPDLSL